MNESRITRYWSDFFGINQEEFDTTGISILPHAYLKGYDGAWIFKRKHRIIISVRQKDLQYIEARIYDNTPEESEVFSTSYINQLFGSDVEKIIGPTFQGYYDADRIDNQVSENVRQIGYEKHEKEITELSNTGDPQGWKDGCVKKDNHCIYAYMVENQIISIANYKIIRGDAGFIGVYTNPEYRGRGYGQEVVKGIVNDLINKGKLALYQTLMSNKSSKTVAKRVGIVEFGRNIAIRLK